jgi:hypothetical protein
MTEAPSSEFMTVTVLRCWGVAPAAGGASLVLETREWGKVAFTLNPDVVVELQRALSEAEGLLKTASGRT